MIISLALKVKDRGILPSNANVIGDAANTFNKKREKNRNSIRLNDILFSGFLSLKVDARIYLICILTNKEVHINILLIIKKIYLSDIYGLPQISGTSLLELEVQA